MSLKKLSSTKPSRSESKQAVVLAMLQRKQGATIATIMKETGWQCHSVRGFLTAVMRSKLGLTLVSEKTGEDRVYRIVANDVSPKRKSRPGSRRRDRHAYLRLFDAAFKGNSKLALSRSFVLSWPMCAELS
jgi:hypothetical protein